MKINKVYYISPRDIRKNRADAVHVVLSCDAISKLGINVELVTPKVIRNEYHVDKKDVFSLYGISEPNFKLTELNTNFVENKKYGNNTYKTIFKKLLLFGKYAFNNRKKINEEGSIIYSKCYISTIPFIVLKWLGLINTLIVFETLTPKDTWLHRTIYKNSNIIISHLKYATDEIITYTNIDRSLIFEPHFFTQIDGIRQVKEEKQELRDKLNFDSNKYYVLYAGKTGEGIREVEYFIECSKLVPELQFLIVGANNVALKKYNQYIEDNNIKNLTVMPFQPLVDYYKYVKAADLLVGYYSATKHNKYNLSPGKSGIYLASKNPCIFSDLPSLRSIFPEDCVYFVEPDNPKLLAEKIKHISSSPDKGKQKADSAFEFAENNSYTDLIKSIINFIESK